MTSQLNVDTIKGQTTAGSVTIQGEGTKTTNLQQGLAKQWVYFSMASTTPVDSLNSSSLTDYNTGRFHHTVTNPFSNTNYVTNFNTNAYAGNSWGAGLVGVVKASWELTTTTSQYETVSYSSTTSYTDATHNYVLAHGDLA